MVAFSTTRRGPIYGCNVANRDRHGCPGQRVAAPVLDAAVWAGLNERLGKRATIAAAVRRLRTVDPRAADRAAVDRRPADVTHRQSNLGRQLADEEDDEVAAFVQAEPVSLGEQSRQLEAEREGAWRGRACS